MACALLLSSVGNGFVLDYVALNVALNESGVQLYIILHSTDTLFACIIAVLLAQARHPRPMGGGRGGRPIGLVVMGAPTPTRRATLASRSCAARSTPSVSPRASPSP